jgi:hypothetical protein
MISLITLVAGLWYFAYVFSLGEFDALRVGVMRLTANNNEPNPWKYAVESFQRDVLDTFSGATPCRMWLAGCNQSLNGGVAHQESLAVCRLSRIR